MRASHPHDVTIVGIVGRAGVGKDEAALHLCRRYGFVRAAFADSLKDMLAHHLTLRGIDYAYLFEPHLKNTPIPGIGISGRELMQRAGEAFRAADVDYWVNALADTLGMAGPAAGWAPVHDRIVVADVRYPNEAAWVQQAGGMLVRLVRESAAPVRSHSSEQFADVLPSDHTLVNNGPTLVGLHTLLDGLAAHCGLDERSPVEQPL